MLRGLKSPDATHLDLMRTYGVGWWRSLVTLRLPASVPYLLPALRLAAASAVIGTVVAEVSIGLRGGIGRMIIEYAQAAERRPGQAVGADLRRRRRRPGRRRFRRPASVSPCDPTASQEPPDDSPDDEDSGDRGHRRRPGLRKGPQEGRRARRRRPHRRRGRVRLADRAERLREEHAAAAGRRPRRPHVGRDLGLRQAGPAGPARPGLRHRLPAGGTAAVAHRDGNIELPLKLHGVGHARRARPGWPSCSS